MIYLLGCLVAIFVLAIILSGSGEQLELIEVIMASLFWPLILIIVLLGLIWHFGTWIGKLIRSMFVRKNSKLTRD